MGGYGSGRTGHKRKVGQCLSLEVNQLHRENCLQLGRRGHRVWSRNGIETGRIGYHTDERGLNLSYRFRQHSDDWESVSQTLPIIRVDCNYGGTRPFFRCSGVVNGRHCARRVGKVFLGSRYFLCRHCYRLAYASQSEERYDRMLRRANKLRVALGGEAGTANWIAPKPKGMWHRTYERKKFEISWCENQADLMFIGKHSHLLSQSEMDELFGV
jgi:hypothetical protein